MKRNLSNLNRGHIALLKRAEKKARPAPLVPKALGESTRPKKPWRSEVHKARVIACGCLVPRFSKSRNPEARECWGVIDPHHVTKWRGGGGAQPSDALLVPLCRKHHDECQARDEAFEQRHGIDFARWIERFSAMGATEIARIRERDAGKSGIGTGLFR